MGKKVSVKELQNQLETLLDQLEQGESHFVVERDNQEAAVLLSMEKFRDIMQMLELLNTLDFIDGGVADLGQAFGDTATTEFPELHLLKPSSPEAVTEKDSAPSRSRKREGSSVEDIAAKLGIRIIK